MDIDYKAKIRKLLALAESPNENEAKRALLKARELMAEHKLRKEDCVDTEDMKVKKQLTDFKCTKTRGWWMVFLAGTVAENYCCKAYTTRAHGKKTYSIGFIGLEDDYDVCDSVFHYAVDCIQSECKKMRSDMKGICSGEYISALCDAYGHGFEKGVKEAFRQQNQQNQELGLVLVTPKEVTDYMNNLDMTMLNIARKTGNRSSGEIEASNRGYNEGKKFDPGHKLEGATA